jgi:adenylosuccinate lyase
MVALENVSLWHERDITHSSVERVIIPDSCVLLDYMLRKLTDVVVHLRVYPEQMLRNLNLTKGLIYSQQVLLALTNKNVLREKAYRMVQACAMRTWETGEPFQNALSQSPEIREHLTEKEIEACFDLDRMLGRIDHIFEKVGL